MKSTIDWRNIDVVIKNVEAARRSNQLIGVINRMKVDVAKKRKREWSTRPMTQTHCTFTDGPC